MKNAPLFLPLYPFFIAMAISAPQFFSPLEESALDGVWEGILPQGDELIHVEISPGKESFLALASQRSGRKFTFTYRLESYSVQRGSSEASDVSLHFVQPNVGGGWITVVGKGYGDDSAGGAMIIATLEKGVVGRNEHTPGPNILLRKGAWTREFEGLSKLAEEAVQKARVDATLEAGTVYNIPIYNQAILAGDWTDGAPSAEQSVRALRAIQLFLDKPNVTSDSEREAIAKIRTSSTDYRVQFIGIRRNNRKVILCNFFGEQRKPTGKDAFSNWKTQKIHRPVGGTPADFWHIEYDPEQDQCSNFSTD